VEYFIFIHFEELFMPTKKKKKKVYFAPSISTQKVIETAALACGKCIGGNPIYQAACRAFTKIS
jgi:hypothetical protein